MQMTSPKFYLNLFAASIHERTFTESFTILAKRELFSCFTIGILYYLLSKFKLSFSLFIPKYLNCKFWLGF